MRTTPVTRRRASRDEVQVRIAAFEASHPGIDAGNYPDAFRDADGELIETEEFFEISGLYSLLAFGEG